MKTDDAGATRVALRAMALGAGSTAALLAAVAAVVLADLDPDARARLAAALGTPRIALLALGAIALVALVAWLQWRWRASVLLPAARLAARADAAAIGAGSGHRGDDDPAPQAAPLRAAAEAVERLAVRLAATRDEAAARAQAARADVDAQRARLAALMAQLSQAVVVCNLEGTVLLFNEAARTLLARGEAGAAAPLGLGRSIFARIDRALIAHALERLATAPTAQCLASLAGVGLIRLRIAGVRADAADAAPEGFVLLLDDLTDDLAAGSHQDRVLRTLADATRGGLANIRATSETLADHGDMSPERRLRFVHAIRDEAVRLSGTLESAWAEHARTSASPWPLEEIRGADLVRLATARLRDKLTATVQHDEIDDTLWIRCDSFALVQAIAYLGARLAGELQVRDLRLRLARHESHVAIDLVWRGAPISSETAATWEIDAFRLGDEPSDATLREVVERHRGEVWFQRERASHTAYFRMLLPPASAPVAAGPAPRRAASRPEFYDFDLFAAASLPRELAERPLAALACTVFDTETTGLDPALDRIVSIAAVRVLNARVLGDDSFEQLVDPGIPVPDAATAIHGIDDAMLAGQPAIAAVLPRFARFADDTVLVAHNAAFDLSFLQRLADETGVRFTQPVLDTLLLSAVAQPGESQHSLEAIARRLGVEVLGRHTALGDAAVTAEVFVRLLPLLSERGITTLGQASEAAQKTWYARLSY